MVKNKHRLKILSIGIDNLSIDQVFQRLTNLVNSPDPSIVVTPNPEIILQAQTDPILKRIINRSDLNIPDGAGLIWAAKYNTFVLSRIPVIRQLQGFFQMIFSLILYLFWPSYGSDIIPERISGVDIVPEIAKICADNNKSIFFLGAGPGVAEEAARRLRAINPRLKIAGTYPGHWQAEFDQTNLKIINQSRPHCLVLAFGAPKEQWWIYRNLKKIPSLKMIIGVGGSLDFITGSASILGGRGAVRAPLWVRQIKLEWLHRLIYQPDRWRRIFNAVIIFPLYIFIYKVSHQNNH